MFFTFAMLCGVKAGALCLSWKAAEPSATREECMTNAQPFIDRSSAFFRLAGVSEPFKVTKRCLPQ
jgi:hypothetical protein